MIDGTGCLFLLQLFLHFTVGAAPSAGVELDIIVEKSCTVREVKNKTIIHSDYLT